MLYAWPSDTNHPKSVQNLISYDLIEDALA